MGSGIFWFKESEIPGEFEMVVAAEPFEAQFPLSRLESEDLLHQMAYALGYKLTT